MIRVVQPSIFDLEQEGQYKTSYEAIYSKLKHYGIDDYYNITIKPQQLVLWQIKEELEKKENYTLYMEDLIKELLKILPKVERTFEIDKNGIWSFENKYYGYQVVGIVVNGLVYNKMSGPFYCIDMLPKHFFEGVD